MKMAWIKVGVAYTNPPWRPSHGWQYPTSERRTQELVVASAARNGSSAAPACSCASVAGRWVELEPDRRGAVHEQQYGQSLATAVSSATAGGIAGEPAATVAF